MTFVVDVEVGVVGLERGDLGAVADHDVGVVGILEGVVLVVVLGAVEGFERDDLGDDAVLPGVGGVELRDVGVGDALLIVVGVEDGGAVGGAGVRTLAIECGGVVDGEEDAEELAVGEARRVVNDFDGFGVVCGFGGDVVVVRGPGGAAGVAGGGGGDALDAFEDGLGAPEAAAGKDCGGVAGSVASGRSVVGGGMGPCSIDSERQAMVESETASARTTVAAERRRIERDLIYRYDVPGWSLDVDCMWREGQVVGGLELLQGICE